MRILLFIFLSGLITVSFTAKADEKSPYLMLEKVAGKLFTRIANSQKELEKFPEIMRGIVNEELMPYIDYKYSAYKILGSHLKKTSKEQRAKFSEAMSYNLERTYALALINYTDQQVLFESEKSVVGHKIVGIKAKIIDTDQPPINMVFKMRINKEVKEWRVFDIVIEGISLLNSKKSELSKRISRYGIEQVTLELMSLEG